MVGGGGQRKSGGRGGSRKHRLSSNCTIACSRQTLMATMQIPIPCSNASDFKLRSKF